MSSSYTVKQGDCLSSIAKAFGFSDWRKIYDDPQNAAFKKKRPNPNVIFPGDVVIIPQKQAKQLAKQAGQAHTFKLRQQKTKLRLRLTDDTNQPFANAPYELRLDGKKFEGKTAGDGKLEQEIPADARDGQVDLFSEKDGQKQLIASFPLSIGHLDPVEEASGVQSRLNNLGFHCGAVDGVIGALTQAALRAFQEKHGLSVTGSADKATRDKLRQLHDWE